MGGDTMVGRRSLSAYPGRNWQNEDHREGRFGLQTERPSGAGRLGVLFALYANRPSQASEASS